MTSSSRARKESSNSNANKRQDLANILVEKKRAISAKYRDRGASGKDQRSERISQLKTVTISIGMVKTL